MAITVLEKVESRRVRTGTDPAVELRYVVLGTADSVAAREALLAESPGLLDPWGTGLVWLPRVNLTLEPIADEASWEASVYYGLLPQTGQAEFSFDTGGGTVHQTQSRKTVFKKSGNLFQPKAPDFGGAIGVQDNGVEGVDVASPNYTFAETHYLAEALITPAYKGTLCQLTGCVNDSPFRGLLAGECLFLGASGSRRGQGDWAVTYRFAGSPNRIVNIGDNPLLQNIPKNGWDYLWILYRRQEDTECGVLVQWPEAVYVERVYEYANFAALGIGT
jgi:hypothetical protein